MIGRPNLRSTVVNLWNGGLTLREVSGLTGISADAVAGHLHRARSAGKAVRSAYATRKKGALMEPGTSKPAEGPDTHELAGEIVREWCLAQIREAAGMAEMFQDPFRAGYEQACEELEERFKATSAIAIFDAVTAGLAARPEEP